MSTNPFAPPRAVVDDSPEPSTRQVAMRKPVATWLLQVACLLLVAVSAVLVFHHADGEASDGLRLSTRVFHVFIDAVVIGCLPLLTIGATQRRMTLGRWSGIAVLVLLAGLVVRVFVVAWMRAQAIGGHPPSTAMSVGLLAAIAGWAWAFAFSRSGRAWFNLPPRERR